MTAEEYGQCIVCSRNNFRKSFHICHFT